MSSTHEPQPEKHGVGAPAHAPQVAVRDGNRLLCPCCGEVLFVLNDPPPVGPACRGSEPWYPLRDPRSRGVPTPRQPARRFEELPQPQLSIWGDIIDRQEALKKAAFDAYCQAEKSEHDERLNRLVDAEDPSGLADALVIPIDPEVAAYEIPAKDPPPLPKKHRACSAPAKPPRPRDLEQQRRRRARERRLRCWWFASRPTPEMKRLRAWTFYHGKRYDLALQARIRWQQAHVDRLRRERLDERKEPPREECFPFAALPSSLARIRLVEVNLWAWMMQVQARHEHAQADLDVAPGVGGRDKTEPANERGPP